MEANDQSESIILYAPDSRAQIISPQRHQTDARWTFWLVVAGISTTFGAAVPTGYNIGVINAPANGGGHMQYGDKGSRETGVVEVFELFEYDRFNFISKIDSLRSTIFFFVAFK
ncbi:uncharacterized protein LOC129751109 isoform X8 [Uranotaenia lowii]|uniref:uncharacterized protein LOC129751109 isoform X8 n=1 Tax=Uranotaenia lowii TaxID=190385 RepID=UPI00247ABB1F|nr:uncharacterized protein LOC129751109 isoform X8 [Uranotaenia lowii]